MYREQYKDINITSESKIVIGLGDSFTQGQGACKNEIWEKYNWSFDEMYKHHETLVEEYEGAWVNQLCKNHLTDHIPINLGMRGCGNRAAVKELYLHPDLNLHLAKEKIVVYMLSGMERFDFINKEFNDHHHFFAMWPNPWDKGATNLKLWEAYAEDIWDDKFGYIEMLLNIAEAQTWCKANNAKFIIVNAFRRDYIKEMYRHILTKEHEKGLIDVIQWDNYLYPRGYSCMTDLLVHLEGRDDLLGGGFYGWAMGHDKLTPKGLFTKCSHPSHEGHRIIAETIYDYLNEDGLYDHSLNKRLI
jgi:hypothetical protein